MKRRLAPRIKTDFLLLFYHGGEKTSTPRRPAKKAKCDRQTAC
ncbi:hypothetical protein [Acidaminobacterium chupaoyuni]